MTLAQPVSAKDNPFAVVQTDSIPFDFQETCFSTLDEFGEYVQDRNYRGAILGRHGHGKTTLLCSLQQWLHRQGTECETVFLPRRNEDQRSALENLSHRGRCGAVVLVDGLERLSFFTRQLLVSQSRSFGGFIATTHRPNRLPTLVRCRTSHQTLLAALNSLNIDSPEIHSTAVGLFSKHRGNLRLVLRELYDNVADGKLS
ncbi:hypothetical protein [Mariniblastus fucicola]|uniref:AAA+ ATPase domain-containing protein n=1 Tax=Mariniblastus fucicola TaxID=980251 RepID=A0A5B9PNQ9_9BACT|nr:hypothetical protein [Mariniblastus fucicola]QEG23883.1 hypothetical protein MFFC18_37870 [Mariniblastus fucicola]